MNRLLRYLLGDGNKNTAVLMLVLLLSISLLLDAAAMTDALGGRHPAFMIPYLIVLLTMPAMLYTIRNDQPEVAKYIALASFIGAEFAVELFMYWYSGTTAGVSFAAMLFVIYSPAFVSPIYYYTVLLAVLGKYAVTGLIIQSPQHMHAIVVLAVLALLAYVLLKRFIHYKRAADEDRIGQYETMLKGIVSYVEIKDPYRRGHSQRVAEYAVALADAVGVFSSNELDEIYQCCLLHDIGMAHMPDHILSKPGRLTKEEYEIVKKHPVMGLEALKHFEGHIGNMELLKHIVLYHHERWDGQGYPEGLKGEDIPLAARITALADAFDSITTRRAYRDGLTATEAYDRIVRGKGSRFDPGLIDVLDKVFPRWQAILDKSG